MDEKLVRVYNKGIKPIVYERSFRGILAIHPRRYIDTSPAHAEELFALSPNAVSEEEYLGKGKRKVEPKPMKGE